MDALTIGDVRAACHRIAGSVRRVAIARDDSAHLALEFLQHTGTFKARGRAELHPGPPRIRGAPRSGNHDRIGWQRGTRVCVGRGAARNNRNRLRPRERAAGEGRPAACVWR